MREVKQKIKNIFHTKGFTLLELLVVVLIIGILAAIALPQYKLVVEKSRATDAITIMNSLQKATELYILQNGYPDSTAELMGTGNMDNPYAGKLDIDVESILICDQDGGDKCRSKDFEYDNWCNKETCSVRARRKQNGEYNNNEEYRLYMIYTYSKGKWEKGCFLNTNYPYSEKLCQSLQKHGWGYNKFE